ncbi:MAG: transposase family protein, partial [Actinobacteria bacterium]
MPAHRPRRIWSAATSPRSGRIASGSPTSPTSPRGPASSTSRFECCTCAAPSLAVVLDAWSRRVIGWAMATHLRTELVLDALNMAVAQRRPTTVIHHSDQG